MKNLVFEIAILAILATVAIWKKRGSQKIDKPKELEDGKFAIPKPEDEFMEEINYDEIRVIEKGIKDPKGQPSGRPQ